MGASKQQVRFGGGERFRVILLDDVRHTESQGNLTIIIETMPVSGALHKMSHVMHL